MTATQTRQNRTARAAQLAAKDAAKLQPADAAELPVRTEPSEAAKRDRAASRRRGEQPVTDPKPATVTPIARKRPAAKPADAPKPDAPKPADAAKGPFAGLQRKSPAAAAKQPGQPKPAKPAKPSIDKTAVVHSRMIAALADLATSWDETSTGITAADAMKIIAHRAAYCSPKAEWDKRFPPRHHNAR